jgi:rhodanese-related sulfurtransferase
VAFVRLVPLLPFNALNYALGLTRIPLRQYVAASFLAMLPGAAAYTYLGYAGREALAGPDNLLRNGFIALALIAAAAYLPRFARRLHKLPGPAMIDVTALERRIATGEPLSIVDVRGTDEYAGDLGHIPASINVPLDRLPARLAELRALQGRSLVLVCRTDKRSAKAADLLSAAGFGRVAVLRGGMEEWNSRSASMEIHNGKNTVSAK